MNARFIARISLLMRTILAALVLFMPATLFSALTWENTVIKETAEVTDTKTEAEFKFTNTGKGKITIDSIRSSCGCTTAELEKREYAPGEKGTIKVVFTFGARVGQQHKSVSIVASEVDSPSTILLELFVEIPESLSVTPVVQYWVVGDEKTERPVVIKVNPKFPGKPVSATMYNPKGNFVVTQPVRTEDGNYRITVTPKSTEVSLTESGEISVAVEGEAVPRALVFHASIRP